MATLLRHLISGVGAASVALAGSLALATPGEAAPTAASVVPPPANATFDYQIGEAYRLPTGVTVVSRDRTDAPAPGAYNICYVNAFQTQPEEKGAPLAEGTIGWWRKNQPGLLLKDARGREVVDEEWDEVLLDTSTAAKRSALAGIVGGWITGCATSGFKAIEPDNIDSYQRSKKLLSKTDAIAYLQLLVSRAHAAGLAIAQKNTTELGSAGKTAGLDFAIAEECGAEDECGYYTRVYGDRVIDIEYEDKDGGREGFATACAAIGARTSVVLRDEDVTAPGSRSYVYKAC
ncbi:endo alpha-1,4 polygalactosaminidase [Winogradskya humida]|uniref:Glycoside-hydrolase family GH114 TIM-barrel domain-containing protein n=1 Tax=Winogradskya humida TaxID=113566 RepID=A0ABQ4A134_9ACTN|nr:endo alpha-1,4 polygalactosaminidase [Actinoplanes humidus]GIE24528.1 hypothetical protein Ahu01nite_076300 [Actinoplanes humidus]